MKIILPFLLILCSCHPIFYKEESQAYLELQYNEVHIQDVNYNNPDCNQQYKYAANFVASNDRMETVKGVICCNRKKCLVLEKVK